MRVLGQLFGPSCSVPIFRALRAALLQEDDQSACQPNGTGKPRRLEVREKSSGPPRTQHSRWSETGAGGVVALEALTETRATVQSTSHAQRKNKNALDSDYTTNTRTP